jgi:hypothetical protein
LGDLFLRILRHDIFLPEFNDLAVFAAGIKSYLRKLWFIYLANSLRNQQRIGCENRRICCRLFGHSDGRKYFCVILFGFGALVHSCCG